MDYRILGPLEAKDGDRPLALGGEKQRALLAILLLHAGEVVAADRLIDDLWGERSPPGAPKALQAHISRLRKTLDANGAVVSGAGGEPHGSPPEGPVVTRGRGYLLRVEPGELDLDRFQTLVEAGRRALARGDPERAAEMLRAALELWRGEPLADLAYEAFAQVPIAQLEELRLAAVEDRVDADLALGRHEQLVAELAALVKQNPLRERLRGQLMLALYRSGRQAEALEIHQEFRRALSEQLGLDPGPGLQQLEVAILARDPSLAPQSGDSAPAELPVAPPVLTRTGGDRRRRRLAVGGLALLALVLAGVAVASSLGGVGPRSAIAADSVAAISPSGGAIGVSVPVGSSPSAMAPGPGAVWVSNYNNNTVSRIDPATHSVVQTIPVDSTPSGIAVGASAVWVANTYSGTVSRIDPMVDRVVGRPIAVGNGPSGVAYGFGSVWVTNSNDGTLSRINALTDLPSEPIHVGGSPTGVAAGSGAVWVTDEPGRQVLRLDPATNQPTDSIPVGGGPTAVVLGFGSVWVTNSLDGTVSRIDPSTDEVTATIRVGYGPNAIAVGAGGVWVANEFGHTIMQIDPSTGRVTRTINVGNRPEGVAISGGTPWVSVQAGGIAHRGGTLNLLTSIPFSTDDPAYLGGELASVLTLYLTNDGLTAFKRVGGSDGEQVVADLAVSLPTPTDNGLTYQFHLRRGIRYSNGQLVRPEDFRWGIERGFRLRSYGYLQYFESLVGGAACVAHPASCDLSHGIVTNDKENTVTFHLVAPDPELLKRLATVYGFAVPANTPVENSPILPHPLPATGPYEIVRYSPTHEVKLVRNPYFHEWSPAARPDGYPNQIIWKIGASPSAAVTAVEQHRADYTIDPPPADRLSQITTRFASQLNPNPNDFTAALFLNTRVAPFNHVGVRQALNYAVDRRRVARMIGLESKPTCELIPPYVPGYQPYCPYTLNPNSGGFAKARALIAASGTRGTAITLWSQTSLGIDYTSTGRYFVSLLNRLGYRAHLRTFAPTDYAWANFSYPQTKAQAMFSTAAAVTPMPSEFLDFFLGCRYIAGTGSSPWWGSNMSEFCNRRLEATIHRAYAAEEANSPTWAELWASADRQATNAAPLVPLVNPSDLDFVSRRVANYEYNPTQGILLDQLRVR